MLPQITNQTPPIAFQESTVGDVYILHSLTGEHFYTGADDSVTRLSKHNSGGVTHTSKFRPRRIKTYVAFSGEALAVAFEKYLKSGSGRNFAKTRL